MQLQHINVKIFVEHDQAVDAARFIDVFHQWIQEQATEEMLIDVADYRHVPAGPGVILIGHEADYSMDHTGHRWGLRYNRKAAVGGSNEDRLLQALQAAANACRMLENHFADGAPLRFNRQEFDLLVNDRALAPNTPETFAACRPELERFLQKALGHGDFTIVHHGDPRLRFGVTVSANRPFELDFSAPGSSR